MMTHSLCSLVWFLASGTPAMTSRGLKESDFEEVGDFLHEVLEVRIAADAML